MQTQIIKPENLNPQLSLSASVVVVLDVFRASNTILALLLAGASRVYVLGQVEQAFALKAAKPQALLLGERQGLPIEGMQGGNSPALASKMRLNGREVILTTSAGTQAIGRLHGAWAVLYGSFANAAVLTAHLQQTGKNVLFLPMGLEAKEPAVEDDLAAAYLQNCLQGKNPDFNALKPALLNCAGAARLRSLGQSDDLDLCCQLNALPLLAQVNYAGPTPFVYKPTP